MRQRRTTQAAARVSGCRAARRDGARRRAAPPILEMVGVTHKFADVTALDDVAISARQGEFLTILGESGSGKTTLLRIISGLETPTRIERLTIAGQDVTNVPAADRNCTTVFQHYALFPHMSVGENVEYGLKVRGVPVPSAAPARGRGAGAGAARRQVRPPGPSALRRRAAARGARPRARDPARRSCCSTSRSAPSTRSSASTCRSSCSSSTGSSA